MKIEKFQLRGNNSACARALRLLRGRAPAQLRGNIGCCWRCLLFTISFRILWRPRNDRLLKYLNLLKASSSLRPRQRWNSYWIAACNRCQQFLTITQVRMPALFLLFLSFSVCYFDLRYSELLAGNTGLKLQYKNNVSCLLTCIPLHASSWGQYFNVDLWWIWCLFCNLVCLFHILFILPLTNFFFIFYECYVLTSSTEAS
jgi:hypothetical protein